MCKLNLTVIVIKIIFSFIKSSKFGTLAKIKSPMHKTMSRHKITCIQNSNLYDIHNKIEFIGGLNHDGTNWKVTQKRAIDGIESGKWEFYVEIEGKVVNVIIATNNGNKYIKTESDDTVSNNLLSLPQCP